MKQWQTLFSWAPKSLCMVTTAVKLKDTCSLGEKLWQIYTEYLNAETSLCWQSLLVQGMFSFSSYVQMWELSYKEGWTLKNWCFWIVVLEKTLKSPLDSKEIKPVNPIRNQPWISIGRNDAETEAPILWPPDVKSWLLGKDPDARKDWRQKEKGMTKNEMVGWHHWLNGHKFEQSLGDSEGQRSLVCCSSWGRKESDMTERLNWTECWILSKSFPASIEMIMCLSFLLLMCCITLICICWSILVTPE